MSFYIMVKPIMTPYNLCQNKISINFMRKVDRGPLLPRNEELIKVNVTNLKSTTY